MFLSSNGCYLRCRGHIYRQPPCNLFISVQKDHFMVRAGYLLPPAAKQQVMLLQQRRRSFGGSMRFRSASFVQPTLDQFTVKRICGAMNIAYRQPTYIKFQ
ncbi:Hypothetical protein SRAE_0000057900 [Strongyloides ratti]|uniref:Uncharacterized protein n=1 Tax=Strongyloides ratti TaxID=34506 RepID=A0A090KVB1_STRRB|nr:Hypothetical protein SRAE_0000057900 [Strongyloides ratti]CEF61455.1 Hypothetical protein SRAE_0000057900 [Strongyloides ratti]